MSQKITLLFLFVLSFSLKAQEAEKSRPKIGLVLSGGGAKGLAEVGAIKVLEEAGIRPDYITGTSIGSIVGGLYASGYSIENLESLAKDIDWEYYFNDEIARINYPVIERGDADKYLLNFPVENQKVKLPTGVVIGKKVSLLFSKLTLHVHDCSDFNNMDIPFRAIATDFSTGEAVVLDTGFLPDAMRASMSIPSIFEPYPIGEKLLIDGGSARNLPVQDVIEMGADIVIAIDVGAPLYESEELTSILQVLDQTSSYRIFEITQRQRALADVLITPDIRGISALDFNQSDTLLARGERAARLALPQILKLVTPNPNLPHRKGIKTLEEIFITDVEILGVNPQEYKIIRNLLQLVSNTTYPLSYIERRMEGLLGSQFVKNVKYKLLPNEKGYKLQVLTIAQSGNFLRTSINYDSDLKAGFLLNATFRNKLFNSSKLSLDLKISENPSLLADYMVYTSAIRPSIGVKLGAKINFYPGYYYEEGELLEAFDIHHYESRVDIFSDIKNRWLVKIGTGWERYSQASTFFDPDTEDLRLSQFNGYFSLKRDTYDRLHFPRKGSNSSLDMKFSFGGSLKEFSMSTTLTNTELNALIRAHFNKIFPLGRRIALEWGVDGGALSYANNNLLNLFYLGRSIPHENNFVEFVGFDYMEQPATAYVFSGLKFRFEPKTNFFISTTVNYGYYDVQDFLAVIEEGTIIERLSDTDNILGIGLELGAMTPLGPMQLRSEYNVLTKKPNFALHLGYVF